MMSKMHSHKPPTQRADRVEIKYSEKDQAILDEAFSTLAEYEKSLMQRIRKDGLNWATTEKEIKKEFMDDETRNMLVDKIIILQESLIPIGYIVKQQSEGEK